MGSLGIIGVALLLLVLLGAAQTGRSLWRAWQRRGEVGLAARLTAALVWLGLTAGLFGVLVGLLRAFAAIRGESVEPSQKARVLAEGISAAMNCTAAALAIGVPCSIVLLVLHRRRKPRN